MKSNLAKISDEIDKGTTPPPVTTREFLSWFGAQRRGYSIVAQIRRELKAHKLETTPDFESNYIDAPLQIARVEAVSDNSATSGERVATTTLPEAVNNPAVVEITTSDWVRRDPTYRLSKLAPANQNIISVKPDSSLAEVVALLLLKNFSQLPLGKELFTAPMQLDAAKLAVHFNQATIWDGTAGEFKYLFLPYDLRAAAGYSTFHATFAVPNLVGAVSTTNLDVRDPNLPQSQMFEIISRRFYKVMIRSIAQSAGLRGEGCTLAFPFGLAALDRKTSEFCPSDLAALVAAGILKEKESAEGSDCFATSASEPIDRRARMVQSETRKWWVTLR
ncbi:hypothetical protein H8A95_23070 [Bradyrhizobium sp. Pear76]|uniref:hypothetical protein n=1 Tax=Bradyrhizobium oropedii TaxID=1571201 RepID=UPI001E51BBA9|nr:hypothetical protein [Bradyrhizobium oropedii]MCC8965117.1 hypothetical protein [Bradyrhizobium oropedii]